MHEREYKRIRSTIEADYRKKLEALELIYSMSAKNGTSNSSSPVKGVLAQAVVSATQQLRDDFDVRDVEQTLKVMQPDLVVKRASVSNTLKRLEGKEVELVERGAGKRPTKYRRRIRA